jgi:hypothetical protein
VVNWYEWWKCAPRPFQFTTSDRRCTSLPLESATPRSTMRHLQATREPDSRGSRAAGSGRISPHTQESKPLEGVPASLGPGLRTASGADRSLGDELPPSPICAMSEEPLQNRKTDLALAIAQGISLKKWAEANNVARSTAYRWADEPEVKACANAVRRRALDRAVGMLSRRVTWAALGIIKLADTAGSEAVKLSALRAIYSEMIATSRFGSLEDRVTELEERSREHAGNAS